MEQAATLSVSRRGILTSISLSVLILVLGALALQVKDGIPPLTSIMWLAPWLLLFWIPPLRMLLKGAAVEFTEAGLTDHTSGLGFISWDEVVSAQRKTLWFGDFVELKVRDPKAFIARLPWLRAQQWRINLRYNFRGPAITANWVEGGAEAVLARIESSLGAARAGR